MSRAEQIEPDELRRLYDRLDRLEREVRELRAARRLESAAIGAGGLAIRDGGSVWVYDSDGSLMSVIGELPWLGEGVRGFVLGRSGGHEGIAAYGSGSGTGAGFVGMYDLAGNYVVTDDTFSGRGLGRPYIPLQVGEISVPTATTTSGSFTDVASGFNPIQHPVLYADLLVRSDDASTTGQVRIAIDNTAVGPTINVSGGEYAFRSIGPFKVTVSETNYGELHTVSVQARRTAGSGSIGVRVLSLLGLESAYAP